jgi:hypothetical protein
MSMKASYQEIYALFFKGVVCLEGQWYSLKPLHSQILSLADLVEVSPENLQHLFVKGGLGKLGRANKSVFFLA